MLRGISLWRSFWKCASFETFFCDDYIKFPHRYLTFPFCPKFQSDTVSKIIQISSNWLSHIIIPSTPPLKSLGNWFWVCLCFSLMPLGQLMQMMRMTGKAVWSIRSSQGAKIEVSVQPCASSMTVSYSEVCAGQSSLCWYPT